MQLYSVNAIKLPSLLDKSLTTSLFDRIEVSNIADHFYIGLPTTLSTLGPLLKSSPHATLITLFMNAVEITSRSLGLDVDRQANESTVLEALKFTGLPSPQSLGQRRTPHDPAFSRLMAAKDLFRDYDALFTTYMRMENFEQVGREAGLAMKGENTIIPPWPLRLKKAYGEPGAQEEFDAMMEGGTEGGERYVEWVRAT